MELSTTSITKGRRYVYDGWMAVAERKFEAADSGTTTLEAGASKLERIYVTGPRIDEWLYAAIDFNSDGDIGDDLNSTECSWFGGVAGKDTADAAFYYLTNRMGSVAALLDKNSDRKVLEYYRYRSYGEVTVLTVLDDGTSPGTASDGIEDTPSDLGDNPSRRISKFANPLTFTGRRLDDATGVMYYRHRMYDPVSGRFVSRDPLGYVDGMNDRAYVGNRVAWAVDSMGLFGIADLLQKVNGGEVELPGPWGSQINISLLKVDSDQIPGCQVFRLSIGLSFKALNLLKKVAKKIPYVGGYIADVLDYLPDASLQGYVTGTFRFCEECWDGCKLSGNLALTVGNGAHGGGGNTNIPIQLGVSGSASVELDICTGELKASGSISYVAGLSLGFYQVDVYGEYSGDLFGPEVFDSLKLITPCNTAEKKDTPPTPPAGKAVSSIANANQSYASPVYWSTATGGIQTANGAALERFIQN